MTTAKVTVMITTFNARQLLPRAVASVMYQSYSNWECVIVDDGSTDETWAWLSQLNDQRIKCIRLETNQGRGYARNVALERSGGAYLSFVDADDWIYPTKLEKQVAYLERNPSVQLVSGGFIAVSPEDKFFGNVWGLCSPVDRTTQGTFYGVDRPPFNNGPTMVRMPAAKAACFRAEFRRAEDLDFWLRLIQGQSYAIQPEPLYVYTGWRPERVRSHDSARAERKVFRQYLRSHPVDASLLLMKSHIKSAGMEVAFRLGVESRLSGLRLESASLECQREYDAVWSELQAAQSSITQ